MMHDAFQTYPTLGAYPGMIPQQTLPYTALQASAINPAAAFNPLAALLGASPIGPVVGITPTGQLIHQGIQPQIGQQQLQGLPMLAPQGAIPQLFSPSPWGGLHNPLQTALIANPLLAASL